MKPPDTRQRILDAAESLFALRVEMVVDSSAALIDILTTRLFRKTTNRVG